MNDYDVKKALAKRGGQQNNNNSAAQSVNGIPNSVLTDVFAGKRQATSQMMGHREELAPSIAAKMSQSFGMDFSAVKVYRSDAMAGTEMHGMAQGDKVVLSSDVDLNTQAGQAVLGHELSHIRAQSMGIGSGRGLLNDASLEHQADSEGMLAARGMNISGESMGMSMGLGMVGVENLSPIGAGLGASAGAPMQASKKDKNNDYDDEDAEEFGPREDEAYDAYHFLYPHTIVNDDNVIYDYPTARKLLNTADDKLDTNEQIAIKRQLEKIREKKFQARQTKRDDEKKARIAKKKADKQDEIDRKKAEKVNDKKLKKMSQEERINYYIQHHITDRYDDVDYEDCFNV